jgi:predicted transposase YdaD
MAQPLFDTTLKTMVEAGPGDWTVFAGQPAAPTRIIDADIATVSGAADKVLRVAARQPYLLHLEFVAGHDAATLPLTLNKRNILLEDRHRLPVRTVVVLLQPAADSPVLTGVRQRGFVGEPPYNVFGYQVIRVWRIPVDHLLASGLGTLPLAPISAVTEAELPGIIKQMGKRLERHQARRMADDLWVSTDILMGLRYPQALVQTLLRGVRSMKESSTYQAIVEEGRQEGRIEAFRKVLLQLGTDQFGEPSSRTQKAIAKLADPERLEALIRLVHKVDSWQALLTST